MKRVVALCALTVAIAWGDKLCLLDLSPEALKSMSKRDVLALIDEKSCYDADLNRDLIGERLGKITANQEELAKSGRNVKDTIYYGGRYYVETPSVSSISKLDGKRALGSADTGVDHIEKILRLVREAKTLASQIDMPHFDKRYLIRDLLSIERGLEGFHGKR